MGIPILYEDSFLLVINKPPGVVVNRAESVRGETVQQWAENNIKYQISLARLPGRANIKREDNDFVNRAGIVHRIDKETSGCLVIAKTPAVFHELQRQFKERLIKKTYLGIVHGKLGPEEGEIRAPVGRLPWNRERFGIVPGGKEAVTKYHIVKLLYCPPRTKSRGYIVKNKKEEFSIVELYPETGRPHQLRVHLKYINHPILGDFQYAGRKVSRSDRAWVPRLMLHAWKISFVHPRTGQELAIEAPIPQDMNRVIKSDQSDQSDQ